MSNDNQLMLYRIDRVTNKLMINAITKTEIMINTTRAQSMMPIRRSEVLTSSEVLIVFKFNCFLI